MTITLACPRITNYDDPDLGVARPQCHGQAVRDAWNRGDAVVPRDRIDWTPDTFTFTVQEEAEGDFAEPGGRLVHRFMTWELESQACGCVLTEEELDALGEKAVELVMAEGSKWR